jgi:hypothetical protein
MHLHRSRLVPLIIVSLLLGCDRVGAGASEPAPSTGGVPQPTAVAAAPAAASPTPAAPAAPAVASSAAPAAAAPADCAALAKHVDAVLRATGSALEKSTLSSVEKMQRNCEEDTNDPKHMACFLAATDSAGFAKCHRDAFPGQVDAKPVRSFHALRDNKAVSPPVFTQDGDYLAYDDDCGMLYKESAPAGAIYISCKGRIEIGPLVTADEVDRVVKRLSAQEDQRHRVAMSLIAKLKSTPMGVPVHVYDTHGVYQGIEYR